MSVIEERERLKLPHTILTALLLVLSFSLTQFNYPGYHEDIDIVADDFVNPNCPEQDLNVPGTGCPTGTRSNLVENTLHGGCWLDSFEDSSGIDWGLSSNGLNVSDSEVKVDSDVLSCEDFESGSAGTVPSKWVMEEHDEGSGTFEHELELVDDRYYDGKQSVFIYSKVTATAGGGKTSQTNLTNKNFFDAQGSKKVYLHISNISVSHSALWGWNCYIFLTFIDGVNTESVRLFWNGENAPGGEQNNFTLKGLGADGNEWFQYNVTIPPTIDKTHMKLRLRFAAGCWTPMGFFSSISANVDRIYFDLQKMNLTSKPIQLPGEMGWDTLILNFHQPLNTNICVHLFDTNTNKPIPGSLTYSGAYEYDLSEIDSAGYTSIRLNSEIERNSADTPVLYYWGVSWRENASWQDTFFGGDKIESAENVRVEDGDATFDNGESIISKAIVIPEGYYLDTLCVGKTEPANGYINITILDAISDQPVPGFDNINENNLSLLNINPHIHTSVKLSAVYNCAGIQTAELHCWSINWTKNTAPRITQVISGSLVDRSKCCTISVYAEDREDDIGNMTLTVEYMPPSSSQWQSGYITDPKTFGDHWECNFTPDIDAELGNYTFRFHCEDSCGYMSQYPQEIVVEVYTKILPVPDLEILPLQPGTTSNLTVMIKNVDYIDTVLEEYEVWFRWYKNYFHEPELDNATIISSQITKKGDVWRCRAVIFDGIDESDPGLADITIRNSPPIIKLPIKDYIMMEDSHLILDENIDDIFEDPDGDTMTFGISEQQNMAEDISSIDGTISLTPDSNWFGRKSFELFANDTESQSTVIFNVTVEPANDLPEIKQVGDKIVESDQTELTFVVDQNERLNLSIIVIDIDGDDARGLLEINVSIPDSPNMYFQENERVIVFSPKNTDVGWHELKINVTDGNETPPVFVTLSVNLHVLNINDMPLVQILRPQDGDKYYSDDKISFTCRAEDIDLLIENSKERLSYRWYTGTPEIVELGTVPELVNISFEPGEYFITIEVADAAGEKAYDSVTITIEERASTSASILSSYYLWIIIAAIIIIIISLLFVFRFRPRRKVEAGLMERPGEAIAPELVVETRTGLAQTGVTKPVMETTTGVPGSLPGAAQLTVQDIAFQQKIQEKIRLLNESLSRGEIDPLTHQMTMLKFEEEVKYHQAKVKPLPQLPPAQVKVEDVKTQPKTGQQQTKPMPIPPDKQTGAIPGLSKPDTFPQPVTQPQQPLQPQQPAPQPVARPGGPEAQPVPVPITPAGPEEEKEGAPKDEGKKIRELFDLNRKNDVETKGENDGQGPD